MDNLFPPGYVSSNTYTHVTPFGVAVICVVLLLLFWYFLVRVPDAPAPFGVRTGMALRYLERSDTGAGFQSAYEPPINWGSTGDNDMLYNNVDGMNVLTRQEVADAATDGQKSFGWERKSSADDKAKLSSQAEAVRAGFKGSMSDNQLLAKARGH